jgi:uncharacterized protein YeaO (DUF488 family)
MSVRIVRLGSPRVAGEGVRVGTVRHPPRGVPKREHASRDFYDVWLPNLAPSAALLKRGQAASAERDWKQFAQRYRAEMAKPDASRILDLLAALSHEASFSVGCYCADEARCHRSLLRALLVERGADVV